MTKNLLTSLIVYRNLYEDELIRTYISLYDVIGKEDNYRAYYNLCNSLIGGGYRSINDYISRKITLDENIFTLSCEKGLDISNILEDAVLHDISILKKLSSLPVDKLSDRVADVNNFLNYDTRDKLTQVFKDESSKDIYIYLKNDYQTKGCGQFRDQYAFSVDEEGSLKAVPTFNPVTMDSIYGYERQKEKIIENTKRFISGKHGLNMLLVGDSGTGKSTTVKALLPMFKDTKLRLIELKKENLKYITKIAERLKDRGMYFIIFIDDLSFDTNEDSYKYLKSVVEGSIYEQADNILFYITSNRKHLIRENYVDRENEVHIRDAINEQTSLADRFITILYYEANQEEYYNIVLALAEEYGLKYQKDDLLAAAKTFAYENGGRTGRTAVQFIKTYAPTY